MTGINKYSWISATYPSFSEPASRHKFEVHDEHLLSLWRPSLLICLILHVLSPFLISPLTHTHPTYSKYIISLSQTPESSKLSTNQRVAKIEKPILSSDNKSFPLFPLPSEELSRW